MGLLERCHSYKDKVAKGLPATHGLFAYPVLMAADILIMQSNVIPVGRDQKQHVEVTRDIGLKFNNVYGNVFTIPEPSIREEVAAAHFPLIRQRVAQAGQGILTNMFEHVAA